MAERQKDMTSSKKTETRQPTTRHSLSKFIDSVSESALRLFTYLQSLLRFTKKKKRRKQKKKLKKLKRKNENIFSNYFAFLLCLYLLFSSSKEKSKKCLITIFFFLSIPFSLCTSRYFLISCLINFLKFVNSFC